MWRWLILARLYAVILIHITQRVLKVLKLLLVSINSRINSTCSIIYFIRVLYRRVNWLNSIGRHVSRILESVEHGASSSRSCPIAKNFLFLSFLYCPLHIRVDIVSNLHRSDIPLELVFLHVKFNLLGVFLLHQSKWPLLMYLVLEI